MGVIDGRGKYLIPGLWDVHVHARGNASYLTLLVANGVTAFRDMGGSLPVDQEWKRQIAEQSMIGPQIFASGPILDGPQPVWPGSRAIANPEQAKQVVDELSQEKADFLKIYSLLPRDAYFALADEAKRLGIRFAGHVPFSVTVNEAAVAGQTSIEHVDDIWLSCSREEGRIRANLLHAASSIPRNPAKLSEVYFAAQVDASKSFDSGKAALVFSTLARNKTVVVPTLIVLRKRCGSADAQDDHLEYVPLALRMEWRRSAASCSPGEVKEGEDYLSRSLHLVHMMWSSGVKIAPGTDAPQPFVVPGFGIHEELELLMRAGIPTSEVLRMSSQGAAELMGVSVAMGTVAVGKRADFLLLNANPLDEIRNTRRIDSVVVGGEFLPPPGLRVLLQRSLPGSDSRSQYPISLNSDQALLVSNFLVKRIREKLPNADLAFLAYHDTVYPPHVVKPEAGVIYFYAPRERCYAHALNDPGCGLNRKYALALENALPTFGSANAEVFEYYADEILYENMTNPPIPEVLSADLQYYHKLGIPAVGALMTNTSNFQTPMLNMFLYPQALWNPARDLNQSLQEYATPYFGDPSLGRYFQDLSRGLEGVLKVCHYEHPGSAWDDLRVNSESDGALEYHVQAIREAIAGPLARASSTLEQAMRHGDSKSHIGRLQGERASLDFTVRQAKIYYHLLKGEYLYRVWKHQHDQQAGLDAFAELALTRYTCETQRKFVATSGIRANPLVPSTSPLEARAAELAHVIAEDAHSAAGVNISGFSSGELEEHLMNGVSGYILSGPTGSEAVVWSDVAQCPLHFQSGVGGLAWFDEMGQPITPGALDLHASPLVVEGKAMPTDKLFDALVESQFTAH